jgi:hypothetical protein
LKLWSTTDQFIRQNPALQVNPPPHVMPLQQGWSMPPHIIPPSPMAPPIAQNPALHVNPPRQVAPAQHG